VWLIDEPSIKGPRKRKKMSGALLGLKGRGAIPIQRIESRRSCETASVPRTRTHKIVRSKKKKSRI